MISLGLDISTSSTGWAVVDDKLTLLDYGLIEFPKDKPHKERLVIFGELITELGKKYYDHVMIEDTFVKFDPSVTKKLSRFAGVAVYAMTSTHSNSQVAFITPQSVRSALFPKQKKTKQDIQNEMIKKYNLDPGIKNDITDAIAVASFPFLKKVEPKWIV